MRMVEKVLLRKNTKSNVSTEIILAAKEKYIEYKYI